MSFHLSRDLSGKYARAQFVKRLVRHYKHLFTNGFQTNQD